MAGRTHAGASPIETSPSLKPANPCLERCVSPLSQASTELGNGLFSRTVSQETAPGSVGLMLPENLDSLWGCLEDGPALTPDGRALDLDGGLAIFFSCSEELAQSHEAKHRAKENARMVRAMQVAHALCEAEARVDDGEICSVGPDGTVRGAEALGPAVSEHAGGARRKLFYRKRHAALARHLASADPGSLCMDQEGKVLVYLYLHREADRRERRGQRLAAWAQRGAQDDAAKGKVLIMGDAGIVRGCRNLSKAPPVIPVR